MKTLLVIISFTQYKISGFGSIHRLQIKTKRQSYKNSTERKMCFELSLSGNRYALISFY